MRLLATLLVLFVCLYPRELYGQRYCDIGTNILSPDSGYLYVSVGRDSFTYSVVNHGPDTIYASDKYWNQWRLANVLPVPVIIREFGKTLAPGDSIIHTHSFELVYYNDRPKIHLCSRIYRTEATDKEWLFKESDSAEMFKNNYSCIFVGHTRKTGGISKPLASRSVYPNPFDNELWIPTIDNEELFLSLYNSLGVLLIKKRISATS